MAPRKKARSASRATSTDTSAPHLPTPSQWQAQTPLRATPTTTAVTESPGKRSIASTTAMDLFNPDPWTDEEEISLFKGIVRWKPAGQHKHLRIMALDSYMQERGHRSEHTRPPGLWAKLCTLYDLDAIDEREHSVSVESQAVGPPASATPSASDQPPASSATRRAGRGAGLKGSRAARASAAEEGAAPTPPTRPRKSARAIKATPKAQASPVVKPTASSAGRKRKKTSVEGEKAEADEDEADSRRDHGADSGIETGADEDEDEEDAEDGAASPATGGTASATKPAKSATKAPRSRGKPDRRRSRRKR